MSVSLKDLGVYIPIFEQIEVRNRCGWRGTRICCWATFQVDFLRVKSVQDKM